MNEFSFREDNTDKFSIDDDEILLSDDDFQISKTPKKKNKFKHQTFKAKSKSKPKLQQQHQQQQQQQHRAPRPMQQMPPQVPFHDKTFEAFANTDKRLPTKDEQSDNDDDDDDDENSSNSGSQESAQYGNDYPEQEQQDPSNEPSPGFKSIEDEKQDLLYRFHRLEQKGVKLPKKYSLYSDIREMRADFERIKRDSEVNASIKFSRRMLMAVVSASEFLNKRYDPFGLELNGWSETVMENTGDGDFDNVFERLHDKYAGRVNTPPEIELMLSLAGSAIMFHMTSTMFKSVPNLGNIAKDNPDMQQALHNMAQNLMKNQNQNQNQSNEDEQENTMNENGTRKMKGPSINLGAMGLDGILPPPMMSSRKKPPSSIMSDNDDDTSSEISGLSVKQVSVTAGGTRRGRKPKITAKKENTIDIN